LAWHCCSSCRSAFGCARAETAQGRDGLAVLRYPFLMVQDLADALDRIARAADLLDREAYDGAGRLGEAVIAELTTACGEDWIQHEVGVLLSLVGAPERARALARALWVGSTVDEVEGRTDRARLRCLRAMELYARLRLVSEELDVRAARELGSASGRLGATQNRLRR
jgi:hypothetical protein